MLLQEIKDGVLNIYELSADDEELINYRKEQMENIPEDKRIYIASEYSYDRNDIPALEKCKDRFYLTDISIRKLSGFKYKNRELIKRCYFDVSDKCQLEKDKLLEKYYQNEFVDNKTFRVKCGDNISYYLLTENKYFSSCTYSGCCRNEYRKEMDNIIELPKTLYLLQLLELKKFNILLDEDIKELIDMYAFNHVNELSLEEIKKMDLYNITQGVYEKVLNKADKDQEGLKLIRKYK